MQLSRKIISEFISPGIEHNFRKQFPALSKKLENPLDTFELIQFLSQKRMDYPEFGHNIGPYEPLEYALKNKIYFHIGGQEYASPIGGSFRRHIFFSSTHDNAIELMIPGQPSVGKRAFIQLSRFYYYRKLSAHLTDLDYLQPVHGYYQYTTPKTFSIYGETHQVNQLLPLNITIYNYNKPWQGKRILNDKFLDYLGNMSLEYIRNIYSNLSLLEIENKFKESINSILNFIHKSYIALSSWENQIHHSELHLANFTLTPKGKIYFVTDTHSWEVVTSPEKAIAQDETPYRFLLYELEHLFKKLRELAIG